MGGNLLYKGFIETCLISLRCYELALTTTKAAQHRAVVCTVDRSLRALPRSVRTLVERAQDGAAPHVHHSVTFAEEHMGKLHVPSTLHTSPKLQVAPELAPASEPASSP